jgi:NAD(P)-dependent dehydrogenase (short-subunit alcohol dehydrogenase family)
MTSPVWFITGASRGFGKEIALAALDRGDPVVAAARNPDAVENALGRRDRLFPVELDVTNEKQARDAATAALERFGQIDILVNNAGRGLLGAVEEASAEDVRSLFAVNVEGVLNVTRAVLPSMRARRSGCVVNISSMAGLSASPGWGIYCATKFALEGLSESMRAELHPLGIRVILVEPGAFRTDVLDPGSLARAGRAFDDYADAVRPARDWAEKMNHAQRGDPMKAAAAIVAVASTTQPPLRVPLGRDCVEAIQEKIEEVSREVELGRQIALSTDYDELRTAGEGSMQARFS